MFTIKGDDVNLSEIDKGKLATICFAQSYQGMRGYVADTLRRMNLLDPIYSLPFAIDFENENIIINSD